MIQMIKTALNNQNIAVYSIQEKQSESVELYFVKRTLDMRRQTKVRTYDITVYHDFKENQVPYRGSASVIVTDGMEQKTLEEKLKSAYLGASFTENGWYPLPENIQGEKAEDKKFDWENAAMKLAEAAFAADTEEDVFINSMEIFSRRYTVRIVNSQNVDVSYTKCTLDGEFVAQCPQPQDVETYESFAYDTLDEAAMQAKVQRVLRLTKDRAKAQKTAPAGKYRLLLSDKYVSTLIGYFEDRSNVALIYQKYSNYRVGDDVQMAGSGSEIKGDRLNIKLKATVPYSREGIEMKDRVLLENGILKTLHGAGRFSHYLGVEPTGEYKKIEVEPGSCSFEEMKKQPYLYVVNFSDFQMDSLSGSFGGEIRLAYWYDGNTVTPVTGGSVNGTIMEAQKQMKLSCEMQDGMGFCGPLAVCVDNVTVAGV